MSFVHLPSWLGILDRKLLRDLWTIRMQALAIALVIAGGVSVQLMSAGLMTSLQETRRAYYEQSLMADIWAPVVRAPDHSAGPLAGIDGVQAVEARIRMPARIEVPGRGGFAAGELISLPEGRDSSVNRLYLEMGRLPDPNRRDEAAVLKGFALANGLLPGDTLDVTVQGSKFLLTITGFVLSAEHVYSIAPGQLVPDEAEYGVLWMGHLPLAQITDRRGSYTEAVFRLRKDTPEAAVTAEIDRILAPYGGLGAYGRKDQVSDAFVSSEIDQLRTLGLVVPPVFLAVAAFLVYVVVSRLVQVQRPAIGLLKAYGYSDFEVTMHYFRLLMIIGGLGLLIGGVLGTWFGHRLTAMYIKYYDFPYLIFRASLADLVVVCMVSAVAVIGGGLIAVRRVARLNPAEAMNPPPPPDFSRGAGTLITQFDFIDQQTRMILRQIVRWPGRAALTVSGVTASLALLISVMTMMDAMQHMIAAHFAEAHRYDAAVVFNEARDARAEMEVARLPGVTMAEAFRAVPVRLEAAQRSERAVLMGVVQGAELSRLLDAKGRPVTPPPGGLVLSSDLAARLSIAAGDEVRISVLEGRRPVRTLPVSAIAETYFGSGAQMEAGDLARLVGDSQLASGVYLRLDPQLETEVHEKLRDAPLVTGVTLQNLARERLSELMDENLGVSIGVFVVFAAVIALGVVYNTVRISFIERQRELASLRVLGFSRGAVSYILLGEVALLTLVAIPFGLIAGAGLSVYFSHAMASDLFRLPFVINPATYAFATLVILGAAALSSLLVRHQIDRLDLVEALKGLQ
ncbi:MAG: ABC transporter permease [Hyphomonas sp.]